MIDLLKERVKHVDAMKATIVEFYRTYVDETAKIDGHSWYRSAHMVAVLLSEKYGYSVAQCAGCISALSPSVLWETNILDAETVIRAHSKGIDLDKVTVSTYGQNKDKCFRILEGKPEPLSVSANFTTDTKTKSFYWNILKPSDHSAVTVDRHAVGVALASNGSDHLALSITKKRYRDISEAYRLASTVLHYAAPCDLQATCWVAYRDNFGGRPTVDADDLSEAPF